jgi:predicted PurR-regulated permease PerM
MKGLLSEFSGDTIGTATAVFGGLLSFIMILVFSFYFAIQERGIEDFLRVVTPKEHEPYVLGLWDRSKKKIGLWLQGQLLLGVIVGVLVFLLLSILGVKHALVLAVVAAVFELIPVFGPTLAAAPAVMVAFVDGGVTLGLLVIGAYVIIQQFENHLIYPLVVTKVVGVPPLLVILALIIGGKLAGFLGIVLSAPIAAILQEVFNDIEVSRRASRS